MLKLSEKQAEEIKKLAEKFGLELFLLFGSQASGQTHPLSDYDFGYVSGRELDYKDEYGMETELKRILGLKYKENESLIDLADFKKVSPLLKYRAIKCNQILFERDGSYGNFFGIALRDYFEADSLFKLHKEIYEKGMAPLRKKYGK